MATLNRSQGLEAPSEIMWLAGPTAVSTAETYAFTNPHNGTTVVVSGSDFEYDDDRNPIAGTYTRIAMFAEGNRDQPLAEISGLSSPLATFGDNVIDDLAAAGIVADAQVAAFGSDTFVFTTAAALAGGEPDAFDFAAFVPPSAAALEDVSFNVRADVLEYAGDLAMASDYEASFGFDTVVVVSSGGIFE